MEKSKSYRGLYIMHWYTDEFLFVFIVCVL